MSERVLITGITGFAGSHLAELLLKHGARVAGIARRETAVEETNLPAGARLYQCDLRRPGPIAEVLQEASPDCIYHLAALMPGGPRATPAELVHTNLLGTLHLLEAVAKERGDATILLAGSSAQYGETQGKRRSMDERTPMRPMTLYGISKLAQSLLGYQYFRQHGLRIVQTVSFNYTGPREPESRACSAFASQIARIEAGLIPPYVEVGNLGHTRDLTDVRDMVEGYRLAIEKGLPGEVYNLCSGRAYEMGHVLDLLLHMSKQKIEVRQDPTRVRPLEVQAQVGNFGKFHRLTGWRPRIPLRDSLRDLLVYWRERARGSAAAAQ